MNHLWNHSESNFQTHQSQQSFYLPYQEGYDSQKYSTKAYINPRVANYEHIKRSLSRPPSLSSSKILVNPNFKGNQEKPNLNYPNRSQSGKSNESFQAGTSRTALPPNEKINSKTFNINTEGILSNSRFKKINKVNLTKPKYSWCKSDNVIPKPNNMLFLKSTANWTKSVSEQNIYKFIASKRKIQTPEKSVPRIYLSKTKIINKAKGKVVNCNAKVTSKPMKTYSPIKIPHYKLDNVNKKSDVLKVAKAVTNKYKYYYNSKLGKNFKYKIDKRNKPEIHKRGASKGVSDISKLFPSNFHARLKLPQQSYKSPISRNICLQRKNLHNPQVNLTIAKRFPNRRVVKIGGILYKTTTNKLTLAKKKDQKKQSQSKSRNHIVYVRGEKFLLDNNGKTLKRQPQSVAEEKNVLQTPKRIDIGGVTYIQKSKNVLVRTNVHQAQYLVNRAKNKSIAILTNLRKRSTLPCMFYHKFGKCNRHDNGLCMYKHDPKNISLCKMFLKGECKNKNCLLSHQAIPEKMATCHFFLNGFCDRENCPFLHVKLNKNVAICENFLQGFCNEGKECSKRHLHQCPNFDKFGSCSLGYKCHYPHKVLNKNPSISNSTDKTDEKVQYFIHSGIQQTKGKLKKSLLKKEDKKGARKKLKNKSLSWDDSAPVNEPVKCVPKRIKLDKLPCYIPL